jgi:hypothetical protein
MNNYFNHTRLGRIMFEYGNKQKTAFFLVFLMIMTPMVSLQNNFRYGNELQDPTPLSKTSSSWSDCSLSNVSVTEVYHYSSNEWIEINNSGNETCDLGEWKIGKYGDSFEIANNTTLLSNGHLVFTRDIDFSFDISCNDQIFISTRNVDYTNATEVTQLDCYGPNDNDYYNTILDGSWELCDGFWDWNEPDEITQNATNLCNGNPFSLSALLENGTWNSNPLSIEKGSSTLSWNVSNLDENTGYELYSSWNTGLNSYSRNYYFDGGIEDITFDMFSNDDWTCKVNINAYIRNQSSSNIEEYFNKDFDVSSCPSAGFSFNYGSDTEIQNGYNFSAGTEGITVKGLQILYDQDYIVEIKLNQDNVITDLFTEECTYTSFGRCEATNADVFIYDETCNVEFSSILYAKSPFGWIEIGSESIEGVGPCNPDSNDLSEPIRLYANMTNSNGTFSYQVVDNENHELNTSTTNSHNFYWAFPSSSYGSEYRFYSYYDGDMAFDLQSFTVGEDTLSDYDDVSPVGDGTTFMYLLPWNATSSSGDCTPYIYSYLYLIRPGGEQYFVDHWSQSMDQSDCIIPEVDISIDWNNSASQDSWTNNIDSNDLLNGTNSMYLNITNLEVGKEYVLEWYSYRSSSYTNNDGSVWGEYYNTTAFTTNSENKSIAWFIDAPGSWCDLDIYYRLHTPKVSQEWNNLENEGEYETIIYSSYDLDPVCDGTDIPEFNPVSLMYNDSGTWVEVNESTNLSIGIYDMKWQVSGINDLANVRLYTYYETYLNSSTQSNYYYSEGNFNQVWELIVSDWSCNINFDFDLDLVLLYSGSHQDMDNSKNNPFIDGPCNTPIDVSSSNSTPPSFSISKLVENSTQALSDGDSLNEGENKIRWNVENTVDDYEHYLHIYLRYNNEIHEFIFESFLGDGGEINGDWSFELIGDVCDISIYVQLYVKEYNGMNEIGSLNQYLSYSGNNSDCYYQDSNIEFLVLDDSNTWNSSLETLSPGIHQMRFDMNFDYVEDVTYYISAYVDAPGSNQENLNGYFSIGQPTSNSNSFDNYFGEDIYFNFTLSPWSCSVSAHATIYYISPTGNWNTFKRINPVYFDVEDCKSSGDISISSFVNGQPSDQLESNYELETGQNDFYWNMTNLSLGENYHLHFYVYKDNIQIYNNIHDYWVADSTSESWHFPVNIEESVCSFYAYAHLSILSDNSYSQVDHISFHPQEPCLPDFEINFMPASSSVWLDAQTDTLLPGTTQMIFDLAELGQGDYEIDYYWYSNYNHNSWSYDNYFTVDENNTAFYWNITLDKLDCFAYVHVNLYDRSYGGNYQIGNYDNILLNGPCMMPFDLDVNSVEYDDQNAHPDLSVGDNDMTWTFDNLDTGINYRFDYYWYNGSNSYSENYYFTYDESNDYTWNLPVGVWDCNPYTYATLYYADNGSHIFGNEYFYFNVPECYNVGIDHTDSNGDYMDSDDLNNGTNDMSWNIYDLPEGYEFVLEMRTYMNGYMQEYSYELFNDSGNVSIDFSIDVDTYSTCDVRVETTLHYLDYDGNWDYLEGNSRYFYPNCDSHESMYPWSVFVDMNGDGNYSEVSQYDSIGGIGTIPMMLDLSNLADDEIYRLEYSWNTATDSEYFNWEDVTSTNNQFYFDVPVSSWDCEVSLYVYIQYETFQGYYNHMISTNQDFNTDCLEPGNASLNMDNMGEVWDDWSNLNNGTNDMSWEMTDLIVGETYTIDWYVKYNDDIVSYEYLTWTAGDSNESISWSFDMDNSTTCNVEIMYRMFVDSGDSNWVEMDNEYFYWYPSCVQWVYPDDNYVNLYVDINGTMVENPETLPSGEVDFEIHFENMSVGADYRLYFYYSNTGFNSNSQSIHFTYDGSPMEMTIDIAPWACSVYFSYDMSLYDFRYGDGNNYNSWYLGSESTSIDGPCESLSYDSSNYPGFSVYDENDNLIDDETDFTEGNNSIILGADNLQNGFPYYMELQVRYDGYLNAFQTHSFTGNNTTMEEFHTIINLPGHVCSVDVQSYLYVTTSSGSNQLNYTNYYADGPCDGSDGESRLNTPLLAYLNGTWVEVDDDTFFPAGEIDMSWDLSGLDPDTYYYMNYNAPNTGWSGYFYGDNIPSELDDWTMILSEFRCDMNIYRDIYAISDYTGWNGFNSQYFYPDNDCLDGGDITLEIQDDEGNWSSYDSGSGTYDLLPGTTNFSWSLDNLLEGYDYEFYWYQQGSDYQSEYQYFTADSTVEESFDFSITIDQYECNVYFYAYLRPMSQYTDMYEDTESFSFHPNEPCYPPFNFAAEDAAGNLSVDALDSDFVLSPGDNHLFFDFNHMDNGTTYYLDWYWSSQYSWNGWYQNYVYVDTTDNVSDGLHFNMTLDSMECYAYVYVNVYNYSNGNSYHMGNYDIDLEGPCMVPFSLDFNADEPIVDTGVNDFTWNIDNLESGSNYTFEYYYSMNSGFYGWYNYEFTYNASDSIDFTINVTNWDCNIYINANIYDISDGNMSYIYGDSWDFYNPNCYEVDYYALDLDGDWIQYNDIDAGTTELFWEINYFNGNIPEGYEFELEYQIITDYDWSNSDQYSVTWIQDDDETLQLPWNITVNKFVCDIYVSSNLYVNTSNGWSSIRGNGFNLYAPCEEMPTGWYNFSMDDDGTWLDLDEGWNNMVEEEGDYEMRLEISDLEIGIWYEMSVKAYMYGNVLYDETLFWPVQDNSTMVIDINMSIPHWYCGMSFETKLSFEHEEEMYEIMTKDYYEEGPCQNEVSDFTESFDVDFELVLINDKIYSDGAGNSQDYELVIPFVYNLNDDYILYLDAIFGNMDGVLNQSEASMAEDGFNSYVNETDEDVPQFDLNGELFESYRYNTPILSNTSSTPILTGSWILEYFNIQGVEISTSITDIEIDDLVPWHFYLPENSDILVQSIEVTDGENGSFEPSNEFNLLAGNYSMNITWLFANIPDPILELEQYDFVTVEFGELTNVMEESFNETMTVHTFQISLTNLSYQEYLVIYEVNADEYYNYSTSYYVYEESSNDIITFNISSDIHTCNVLISIGIYDRNEAHLLTQNYSLEGTCQPYDYDMDGISNEDDAFPYDPSEWQDTDGDGVGDNSDAFPEDSNEWLDTDGDGVGNNNDTDDDNDGIDDESDNDNDGDGVNNEDDAFPDDPDEWNDTDGDGYGDNFDAFNNDSTEWQDTDGDGIGDNSDDDADGDGIPNDSDGLPLNPNESSDSDNDGIGDNVDAFPNDPNEQYDTDGDGLGDNADTDDDGDGVLDSDDAFPEDSSETMDTDGDGLGDNADTFPNDASEKVDSDNDGVGDNADIFPSNADEWSDSDNDGVGDNSDAFPNDSSETTDSDGDGVGDNSDMFPYDSLETTDSDGDGVGDNADTLPNDSTEQKDSDGDGVGDNSDAFPNDSSEDTDSDGDGVGDNSDGYPNDPFRTEKDSDSGFLPGFSSVMGIVSLLGAAIIVTGRRKE